MDTKVTAGLIVIFLFVLAYFGGSYLGLFAMYGSGFGIGDLPANAPGAKDEGPHITNKPICWPGGGGIVSWCRNYDMIGQTINPIRAGVGSTNQIRLISGYVLEDAEDFAITDVALVISCDDGTNNVGSVTITNPSDNRISYQVYDYGPKNIHPGIGMIINAGFPYIELDMAQIRDQLIDEEFCQATGTLMLTKVTMPSCGDENCDPTESCADCPQDCGPCDPLEYCGDGICQESETQSGCPEDCGYPFGWLEIIMVVVILILIAIIIKYR